MSCKSLVEFFAKWINFFIDKRPSLMLDYLFKPLPESVDLRQGLLALPGGSEGRLHLVAHDLAMKSMGRLG